MGDSPARAAGERRRPFSGSQKSPSPVRSSGKRAKHGEWWSKELGVRVEIGDDFVPDTQNEGGDDFIFFPDSQDEGNKEVCSFDVDATGASGDEQVQHMRTLCVLALVLAAM